MASTSILEISNGLSTTANDETNGSIRDHDLDAVLSLTETTCRTGFWSALRTSRTAGLSVLHWVATILVDDSIDFPFGIHTSSRRASDSTMSMWTSAFRSSQELNATTSVLFDSSEVLALTANDKTNQMSLNHDRF